MAIQWRRTVGQERIKSSFSRTIESGQIGHAYLFAGKPGVGKFSLALELAMTLLCESESKPCYECSSCRKVLGHSHPDFRYLFPLNFTAEHKKKSNPQQLSDAGWDFIASEMKLKLADPYHVQDQGGTISVEWIREMNQAISRGASGSGWTVVIIDGIDTLRAESANAMLKTLEEPPVNTVMILLTESVHGVLPTIKSRCQIHRFGSIEPEHLAAELNRRFPDRGADIPRISSLSYGSLGTAITLMEHDETGDSAIARWFDIAFTPNDPLDQALALESFVESELEKDFPRGMKIVNALIEECRFAFLHRYGSEAEYIFSATAAQALRKLSPTSVEKLISEAENALVSLKKHSPMVMVFVNLTLNLLEICNE